MPTATELIAAYKAGGNKDLSTAQITGGAPLPTTAAPATIAPVAAVNVAPTKTAVPVISSAPASTAVTSTVKPALDSANAALAEQQRQRSIALAEGKIKSQADMDAFTKQQQTSATKETALSPADQAAADVANTPDNGFKWAYTKDGTRTQIPINSNATQYGFTDTKPIAKEGFAPSGATQTETVPLDNGTSLAKLSDGTYGSFDEQGNYVGSVNEASYNNSKLTSNSYKLQQDEAKRAELNTKIDQIINGTYPLTSDQQAQIDSVKKTYSDLISAQGVANKSYVGGVQVSSARSGGMEYSPTVAMGEVKNAIDQGEAKIASLNNELLGTIAKMNSAFRSDNMEELNTAYKNYSDQIDKRQAEIDKIREASAKALNDARNYNLEVEKFQEKAYYDELSAKLAQDTLSLNEKKALLEDARANASLSEEKRHNLATELDNQQKNALKAMELTGETFDPDTPFASTINSVARNVGRLDRGNFVKQIADSAKRKDWPTMLTDMKNAVNDGLPAADRTKLNAHENSVAYLTNMENLLKQYKAAGGDTGFLVGTAQGIATKYGQTITDPRLIELQTQMNENFVRFRSEITGAAFSPAESKGYESLVPSANKNVDLNLSVINGARSYAQQQADAIYSQKMGKSGYENLAGLVDAEEKIQSYVNTATPEEQSKISQMVANGESYSAIMKYLNLQ